MTLPAAALCCLLLAVPSVSSAGNTTERDSGQALILYSAPQRRVLLTRDFRVVDTEEFAEYANPVADTPSKVVTVEKSTQADPAEVEELLRGLRESGFHALKHEYGAGPKERSYPTAIAVSGQGKDGEEKRVVYRSRPGAGPKPKAFAAAEEQILAFARKAVAINSGE